MKRFVLAMAAISVACAQSELRPKLPGTLPGGVSPSASFSIEDSESVRANFGQRIANRYLAIDVAVYNPTSRKIQLDKASLWFEVDYATIPDAKGEVSQILEFGRDHQYAQFAEAFPSVLGTFDAIAGGRQKSYQIL